MVLDITKGHAGGLDVSEECVEGACQHHGAQYTEYNPPADVASRNVHYGAIANGATIVSAVITITKRCCVVVNAAAVISISDPITYLEIERPQGTIKTTQEDSAPSNTVHLTHHAAWEVLDPGTYTYYLMNRGGTSIYVYTAWMKVVASDCEG